MGAATSLAKSKGSAFDGRHPAHLPYDSAVMTPFGNGHVIGFRATDGVYHVKLSGWGASCFVHLLDVRPLHRPNATLRLWRGNSVPVGTSSSCTAMPKKPLDIVVPRRTKSEQKLK